METNSRNGKSEYQACRCCSAKWFFMIAVSKCPRCGSTELLAAACQPPWHQKESTAKATQATLTQCNHTAIAVDSTDQTNGSWEIQQSGANQLVVCRICNKVYGQITSDKSIIHKTYLKQQERRACPGCGEEPFLG